MTTKRYTVIESKVWKRDDGYTVSVYGACPWMDDSERARWQLVVVGYTVHDFRTNTVGIGRAPWTTREEAQVHADRLNLK